MFSPFRFDNVPGYVAPIAALRAAMEKGGSGSLASSDGNEVLGRNSMKVWLKWKELFKSADSAGDIIRFIWTDLVASAVVGTKGPDNSRAASANTRQKRPVFPTRHEVKYKYVYTIPACHGPRS
jgi:hypothetical protein